MEPQQMTPLIKKTKKRNKKLEAYYKNQQELLASYEEDDQLIAAGGAKGNEREEQNRADILLSKLCLAANVFLLVAKAAATYLTSGSSLAIISTLLDSVVDITSGLAIWFTTNAIENTNYMKYPRGRNQLENVSIIFIGVIMGSANIFIVLQSAATVIMQTSDPDISMTSIFIIVGTIVVKSLLWLLCTRNKSNNSRILAIDQRNDVFTNIVAIAGAALSQYWTEYADPAAAMVISGYVAVTWLFIIMEQIPQIAGIKCTQNEFSRVARVIITHSKDIKSIETLLIYHTGCKVRVEAHIVLDEDMPSREVHDDFVEPLQKKLMMLPFVERAFVHPDYELDGYD